MFNSLNSLSSLISDEPGKAEKFLDEMSKVYRYLLRTNEDGLTTLESEMQFIQSYFHLLKTRYGEGLMEQTIKQMGNEENILNKILWKYYSDTEIIILNQRTASALPQEQPSFRNWLVRGLSNAEIVGLMKAVGKNAPDYVFNSLLAIAEKELPGIRYSKVIEGLTNGAMVA